MRHRVRARSPSARARLHLDGLDDSLDAAQSLEGLESYSHVWLVWLAHLNGHEATNSKVAAPHLRGKRTGLFATRSPYRPNPIGLTLARLDRVERETVHLSGVDLVHGTPILDIKPHIPSYDQPDTSDALGRPASTDGDSEDGSQPRIAAWTDPPPLDVSLAPAAAQWLDSLAPSGERLLPDADVLQACLCECLSADPRPLYRWRRQRQGEEAEYVLCVDGIEARCRFAENAEGRCGVTVTQLRIAAET